MECNKTRYVVRTYLPIQYLKLNYQENQQQNGFTTQNINYQFFPS